MGLKRIFKIRTFWYDINRICYSVVSAKLLNSRCSLYVIIAFTIEPSVQKIVDGSIENVSPARQDSIDESYISPEAAHWHLVSPRPSDLHVAPSVSHWSSTKQLSLKATGTVKIINTMKLMFLTIYIALDIP